MAISKKIISFLDRQKYKYQIVEHRTTFTAWDTAQTEHVKPQEVSKALVLKLENVYALALLPANKNLDKQKFLKVYNAVQKKAGGKLARKVEFAKELWMKKNILGKVGATMPFAEILKIQVFADKTLFKSKKIYVGSGEYEASFLISTKEFEKKEKPLLGSFSAARK
jgi:Ala-tRNA(Pro) deacylase